MARPIPMCIVENCHNRAYKRQYCEIHYDHFQRYGKVFQESRYNRNEVKIIDDYAEMALYNKHGEIIGHTLIDIQDIEKAQRYKWHMMSNGYVAHKSTKISLLLHRYLTDPPKGMVVDHINRNPLDNRRSNLRICTQKQNARNLGIRSDNTSGYKGVRYHPQWGWQAYIANKGKQIHVGWYKTKEEAVKARMRRANEFYGGFANEIP